MYAMPVAVAVSVATLPLYSHRSPVVFIADVTPRIVTAVAFFAVTAVIAMAE